MKVTQYDKKLASWDAWTHDSFCVIKALKLLMVKL